MATQSDALRRAVSDPRAQEGEEEVCDHDGSVAGLRRVRREISESWDHAIAHRREDVLVAAAAVVACDPAPS